MEGAQKQVRELLSNSGATKVRTSGGKEIWSLSTGERLVCPKKTSKVSVRAWKSDLARLRRILRANGNGNGEASASPAPVPVPVTEPAMTKSGVGASRITASRRTDFRCPPSSSSRFLIKSWNAYVKGRKIEILRWSTTEGFPKALKP